MTLAVSIRMGLNQVNPDAYAGWAGQLAGCHNDAQAMRDIVVANGFAPYLLLDGEATSDSVIQVLGEEALKLNAGDCCLITFSGNGGQTLDANGDEADGKDETWVFYDRMLIGDELYQMWGQFADSVRIIVVSDSCHSRSVIRDIPEWELMSLVDRRQKSPPDLHYKGLAGAVMQMGMTVMAHNGTILVHIRQQRLPKRGEKFRQLMGLGP